MAEIRTKDLTNVNAFLSGKRFADEEIHGQVKYVIGNTIGIAFIRPYDMKKVADYFKHALCMFKSGAHQGEQSLISGSVVYHRALDKILYITLKDEMPNLSAISFGIIPPFSNPGWIKGDQVRIRWDVTLFPEEVWDDGDEVHSSNFEGLTPNTKIVPAGRNIKFYRCNINNDDLPAGCTSEDADGVVQCNHWHTEQNDLERWIVDKGTLLPTEPLNKDLFLKYGLSIDPQDIPAEKLTTSVTETKRKELEVA